MSITEHSDVSKSEAPAPGAKAGDLHRRRAAAHLDESGEGGDRRGDLRGRHANERCRASPGPDAAAAIRLASRRMTKRRS